MHRFRGTDIWLGLLAVVVNIGLVVGVVLLTTGRPTADEPTPAQKSSTTTATTTATPSKTTTTTTAPRSPEALLASDAKVTLAILGDQTSDGEAEWVTAFSQYLAQDRKVTLNRLNPADPTTYTIKSSFGASGPSTVIYNGSRAGASANYATQRVPFLVPVKPDFVILNYGRNDSASTVKKHLQGVATAVKKQYPSATLLVTLQPPTLDDQQKKVRAATAAWARSRSYRTLDVATAFIGTGAPNSYVSTADPQVLNSRGDALWGETVFTLLGGTVRVPEPAPTTATLPSVTTTSSAPSPSSSSSAPAPAPPASTSSSSTPPPPAPTDPTPTDPTPTDDGPVPPITPPPAQTR